MTDLFEPMALGFLFASENADCFLFTFVFSANVTAKEVLLRKYDTLVLKAPHVHHNGAGPSVIANIALTFVVMFASIVRFIF